MIQAITDYAVRQARASTAMEELDEIKLRYTLEVILGDVTKTAIMFLFFTWIGMQIEFIYALIALFTLRICTGGLHFKTYWGCLTFSIAFFILSISSSRAFPLSYAAATSVFGLLVLTIMLFAPVLHPSRPPLDEEKKIQLKAISILYLLLHLALGLIIEKNPYFAVATWVFIYQGIQLIAGKVVNTGETHESAL